MLSKLQRMNEEKEYGFTLIELLVVILIIGILAAIAIPMFMNQRKAAVDSSVQSDLRNAATQVETLITKSGASAKKLSFDTNGNVVTLNDDDIVNEELKIQLSDGTKLALKGNTFGYCLHGTNEGGDIANDTGFTYVSQDGGLKKTGGNCDIAANTGTTTYNPASPWTGGVSLVGTESGTPEAPTEGDIVSLNGQISFDDPFNGMGPSVELGSVSATYNTGTGDFTVTASDTSLSGTYGIQAMDDATWEDLINGNYDGQITLSGGVGTINIGAGKDFSGVSTFYFALGEDPRTPHYRDAWDIVNNPDGSGSASFVNGRTGDEYVATWNSSRVMEVTPNLPAGRIGVTSGNQGSERVLNGGESSVNISDGDVTNIRLISNS